MAAKDHGATANETLDNNSNNNSDISSSRKNSKNDDSNIATTSDGDETKNSNLKNTQLHRKQGHLFSRTLSAALRSFIARPGQALASMGLLSESERLLGFPKDIQRRKRPIPSSQPTGFLRGSPGRMQSGAVAAPHSFKQASQAPEDDSKSETSRSHCPGVYR